MIFKKPYETSHHRHECIKTDVEHISLNDSHEDVM